MHEDFYSVATTVVLFFSLGGIYAYSAEARPKNVFRALALTLTYIAPAVVVINVSLLVLSGIWRDTQGTQVSVFYAALFQVLGGGIGLAVQSLRQHEATTQQNSSTAPSSHTPAGT